MGIGAPFTANNVLQRKNAPIAFLSTCSKVLFFPLLLSPLSVNDELNPFPLEISKSMKRAKVCIR